MGMVPVEERKDADQASSCPGFLWRGLTGAYLYSQAPNSQYKFFHRVFFFSFFEPPGSHTSGGSPSHETRQSSSGAASCCLKPVSHSMRYCSRHGKSAPHNPCCWRSGSGNSIKIVTRPIWWSQLDLFHKAWGLWGFIKPRIMKSSRWSRHC